MPDFTLKIYQRLLKALIDSGYRSRTLDQYFSMARKGKKLVILRHDVDRWASHAHQMAQLEHSLGVRSTYYFRYPKTFVPSVITAIHKLGHEIGFHYECLDQARGNVSKAKELFKNQLKKMRSLTPVSTAAMHGNPLSPYDNRDILRKYSPKSFGLKGEAYLSMNFKEILYVSDTGRTWNSKDYNLKDKPSGKSLSLPNVHSTGDLIVFINHSPQINLYITTHPERWSANYFDWAFSFAKDLVANSAKFLITCLRQ